MKLWQRASIALILGIVYLVLVRPVRGYVLSSVIQAVDEAKIEVQGYKLNEKSPVHRVYIRQPDGKQFQFKAPVDSFFMYGLIFSVFYGVPLVWMGRAGILHLVLWTISFVSMFAAVSSANWLNVADAISRYINPVVTLSIIPLWIFQKNQVNSRPKEDEHV